MTNSLLTTIIGRGLAAAGQLEQMLPKADGQQPPPHAASNPSSWDRIRGWFNGFNEEDLLLILFQVLVILVGMWVLRRLAYHGAHRVVKLVDLASGRDVGAERENRANTLAAVLRNTANVLILVGGILMILQAIHIPVAPLLGGVAVAGLAVAFGAQNLIKDYFTGFTILLEDQYGVNDVVKIGNISGLVERISLRMTVLRDLEGSAHFIPHGQVNTVTNMTHGWARALFDVRIAYKENVDRVIEVLMQLGREARQDSTLGALITNDPEMLGVNQLDDSAVVVRFMIRTRPLQQWAVKREMQRRIKNKFDELGIEIPFPHQTVYLRPNGGRAPADSAPAEKS